LPRGLLSFVLSLVQTLTSLQEQSLTSVPRLAAWRFDSAGGHAVVSGPDGGLYALLLLTDLHRYLG
jgi:flagellar biosynthesis protein FliQ